MPWCCFALFNRKALLLTVGLIYVLDGCCCFAIQMIHLVDKEAAKGSGIGFGTLDVLVCFGLRLLLIPGGALLSTRLWRRIAFQFGGLLPPPPPAAPGAFTSFGCISAGFSHWLSWVNLLK